MMMKATTTKRALLLVLASSLTSFGCVGDISYQAGGRKPSPEEPPVTIDPPREDPPSEDPPGEDPPSEDPPGEDPPGEDPPGEDPPTDPPSEDPPPTDPPGDGYPSDMCGDLRVGAAVYFGETMPSAIPLTTGQNLAIGLVPGCTATLITPTWALTAAHCNIRAGSNFCMGHDRSRPDMCTRINRVISHPDYNRGVRFAHDVTLLELADNVPERFPEITPIPIWTDPITPSNFIGETLQAGGYGENETGRSGTKFFVSMDVTDITPDFVTLTGYHERGICFGDSGSSLLALAPDGTVRSVGDLSHLFGPGARCRNFANWVRVDIHREWIEGFTGPTVVEGATCGSFDEIGECRSGRAMYCGADDELQIDVCGSGQVCGWDGASSGYRCVSAGSDPCGGFDSSGGCDGNTARWCDMGTPRSRDCAACGQTCGDDAGGLANCLDDPCGGLDFRGECVDTDGNGTLETVRYCDRDGTRLHVYDCSRNGGCGEINPTDGMFCLSGYPPGYDG